MLRWDRADETGRRQSRRGIYSGRVLRDQTQDAQSSAITARLAMTDAVRLQRPSRSGRRLRSRREREVHPRPARLGGEYGK